MKTAYIDLPLGLLYFSSQIAKYVLDQGYIPLNPFHIFAGDMDNTKEAMRTLREQANEVWVFRNTKKFPKGVQRNFLIRKYLTIEEII